MSDYQQYTRLRIERTEHGVLEIALGEEGKLDALDELGHEELSRIWVDIDRDEQIRAVLVRGLGKRFSAGGTVDLVKQLPHDHELRMRTWREARDLVLNMLDCSKPVVSAVHGPAVGAGLAVALLADISVVARNARLIDGPPAISMHQSTKIPHFRSEASTVL